LLSVRKLTFLIVQVCGLELLACPFNSDLKVQKRYLYQNPGIFVFVLQEAVSPIQPNVFLATVRTSSLAACSPG
jgi:hypothetical protein